MRWIEHPHSHMWTYEGARIIGMVVPVAVGPFAGKVGREITAVAPDEATRGFARTVSGAKAELQRAWTTWLRERGLGAVS